MTTTTRTAVVTGASQGLGLELTRSLVRDGWAVLVDARHADVLVTEIEALDHDQPLVAIAGDITDTGHRDDLSTAAASLGGVDVLVLNAGTLGPSPLPSVEDLSLEAVRDTLETNLVAQIGLVQALLPHLRPGATIVAVTSDAAVEAYEGWAAYAAAKAGLEQVASILAVERPDLRVLRVDPGDMQTAMHQAAFPGEDISDRPLPAASVPGLRGLLEGPYPSGRYRVVDVPAPLEVA